MDQFNIQRNTGMSDNIAMAAVCLWEVCLEEQFLPYVDFRNIHGACETRDRVISFALTCELAWFYAQNNLGYDAPFDWDWCPRFLVACVDQEFELIYKDPERAARAVMGLA